MCKTNKDCNCNDHNPNNPGKFENEPDYVVHFWNMAMGGFSDREEYGEDETKYSIFDIIGDDIVQFPELDGYSSLTVYEDSQGFVYCDLS